METNILNSLITLVLTIIIISIRSTKCDLQEVRLLRYLMSEYDPAVRPAAKHNQALVVKFSLSLHLIIDVDEKNQILTTNCWITQVWIDSHLTWNSSEFGGISVIRIPVSRIWKPDTILYNNADSQFSSSVTWLSHGIFKSSCDINVEYFPFDIQNCTMKWASWTYDGYSVDLQITESEGDMSNYHANGEFDLIGLRAKRNVVIYSCCPEPYPDITMEIILKRRHYFYVFNLIIPCCLINGIALLVFFVPSDSGEKVTLGISALLSMTVFLMTIRESLPPTEKTPLIGFYYGVSIFIVTFASGMAVVTLNIHHRGFRGIRVPKLIRFIMFRILGRLLLIQKDTIDPNENLDIQHNKTGIPVRLHHQLDPRSASRKCDYLNLDFVPSSSPLLLRLRPTTTTPNSTRSLGELNSEELEIFSHLLKKLNHSSKSYESRVKDKLDHENLVLEWKKVAYICDRVLFIIFTICTFVSTFTILSSQQDFNMDYSDVNNQNSPSPPNEQGLILNSSNANVSNSK